jgi:hypothetical protein
VGSVQVTRSKQLQHPQVLRLISTIYSNYVGKVGTGDPNRQSSWPGLRSKFPPEIPDNKCVTSELCISECGSR